MAWLNYTATEQIGLHYKDNYMAFSMSFTDEFNTTYPNSYWRVAQTNICQASKTGHIVFYGFQDADNKGRRVIGQKSYAIDEAAYLANFDADSLNPSGANPVTAAYLHAAATLDTDDGGSKVGFFSRAEAV